MLPISPSLLLVIFDSSCSSSLIFLLFSLPTSYYPYLPSPIASFVSPSPLCQFPLLLFLLPRFVTPLLMIRSHSPFPHATRFSHLPHMLSSLSPLVTCYSSSSFPSLTSSPLFCMTPYVSSIPMFPPYPSYFMLRVGLPLPIHPLSHATLLLLSPLFPSSHLSYDTLSLPPSSVYPFSSPSPQSCYLPVLPLSHTTLRLLSPLLPSSPLSYMIPCVSPIPMLHSPPLSPFSKLPSPPLSPSPCHPRLPSPP